MILIHTHFHYQRTGVTRSIENVLPFFDKFDEIYVAGRSIDAPTISFFKMMKLVFSKNEVVVHCHRNNEILRALFLRLIGARFRLVSTRHAESKPSGFTMFLHKKTDAVITLTSKMSKMFSYPTTVVGHGIDLEKFFPSKNGNIPGVNQKHVITCAGRVRNAKGQQILVEAALSLLKTKNDWALVIVGKIDDSRMVDEMKTKIANNDLSDQIYFLNETPEIVKIYQSSHTVVVPSFSEGFSLVCAEAMACECNVIATAEVGIHDELIISGKNGYLFQAGDKNGLKNLLNGLMNNDLLHLGGQARKTIETYWSAQGEADKLTEVYLRE